MCRNKLFRQWYCIYSTSERYSLKGHLKVRRLFLQCTLWTVAPMDEGTILVYCCPSTVPSLWPPPPSPLPSVQYMQTVCDCGGGGVLKCTVDHILQEFYTLFLTRFRTYKIASPPQTKMTSEDDIKGAQAWDIRSLGFSWFLHHKVSTCGRLRG